MLRDFGKISEAIVKITGSLPAYTRPRAYSAIFFPPNLCLMWLSAYGEYDDKVRRVAAARGQQLVNWDLEYVVLFLFRKK